MQTARARSSFVYFGIITDDRWPIFKLKNVWEIHLFSYVNYFINDGINYVNYLISMETFMCFWLVMPLKKKKSHK